MTDVDRRSAGKLMASTALFKNLIFIKCFGYSQGGPTHRQVKTAQTCHPSLPKASPPPPPLMAVSEYQMVNLITKAHLQSGHCKKGIPSTSYSPFPLCRDAVVCQSRGIYQDVYSHVSYLYKCVMRLYVMKQINNYIFAYWNECLGPIWRR